MKICIDIQSVILNPKGVGRYTLELVRALSVLPQKEDITLSYFDFLNRFSGLSYFPNKSVRAMPGRFYNKLWKKFHFPPLNWLIGDYDVYHFPNFCLPPMSGSGKNIITVHDLAFVRFPEYIEPKNLVFLQNELPGSLERADKIIAVSNFTKNEIIGMFKIPSEKIAVIYEGITLSEGDQHSFTLPLPEKYILFVGTLEPRKNIEGLIRAFKICGLRDYKLVIVGQKGWFYEGIFKLVGNMGLEKEVIFMDYVPQNSLSEIYKRAKAFVFPSFYEGFGLPPLEAMAYKTPVVSTKLETLGDAARFVDPNNPKDIAAGIINVLGNSAPWIVKGFEHAKKFSWQKTAQETMALYKSLVN